MVSTTTIREKKWQGTEAILWVTLIMAGTMILLMAFIQAQQMVIFAVLSTAINIPIVYRYSHQLLEEY